ncbi:Isochorismatase family [Trypanosoma brucei equiperdum]|uniref:nicotinamidase n=1 Tax=Trypanosoma brucei equiperdum TaxID=630700 RepID=A0A3L6L110_9TRYP|nr:Isochorismatase family [Trypanosoma brucei equiperdum]
MSTSRITLSSQHDALIIVDMQNDFVLPDGALSVTGATEIIPIINRVVGDHQFRAVVASMDWHPPGHMSFRNEDGTGGPWPPHCVRSTTGAQLHSEMKQGEITHLIHKATSLDSESYSAFSDDSGKTTGLAAMLRAMDVRRVFYVWRGFRLLCILYLTTRYPRGIYRCCVGGRRSPRRPCCHGEEASTPGKGGRNLCAKHRPFQLLSRRWLLLVVPPEAWDRVGVPK